MSKKIVKTRKETINGEQVTVKIIEPKQRKVSRYVDRSTTDCPYCKSTLVLNSYGKWECTGDKLKIWANDFYKYYRATEKEREHILSKFSNVSRFLELYDRWAYDIITEGEATYDCGYTNEIFPLIATCQEKIPDPLVTKRIEKKLGRKLTLEELLGEHELYAYGGRILTEWRKNAKQIRIPWIILPAEVEVSV